MYNSCYTYFSIFGKFDPDEVTKLLNIKHELFVGEDENEHKTDEIKTWRCGFCTDINLTVYEQIRETIAPLLDKVDILKKFHDENDVEFYIEVVPEYATDMYNFNCGLFFPIDIIDFCHATRTEIDVDIYLWSAKKKKSKKDSTDNKDK